MNTPLPLELRLALVFTPADRRAAVQALDALLEEIGASLAADLDHTVAHTRLVWWRGELARLDSGAPLHPITQTLYRLAPGAQYARLEALITAAELQLAGHQPANASERSALFASIYGAGEMVRAQIVHGSADARLASFGRALGEVYGYAACLDAALLDDRRQYAQALREALLQLTPTAALAPAQRHGLIRAALIAHRLTAGALKPPPHHLTALFIAWRTARRHRLELR
jgi:hypothetical protein